MCTPICLQGCLAANCLTTLSSGRWLKRSTESCCCVGIPRKPPKTRRKNQGLCRDVHLRAEISGTGSKQTATKRSEPSTAPLSGCERVTTRQPGCTEFSFLFRGLLDGFRAQSWSIVGLGGVFILSSAWQRSDMLSIAIRLGLLSSSTVRVLKLSATPQVHRNFMFKKEWISELRRLCFWGFGRFSRRLVKPKSD